MEKLIEDRDYTIVNCVLTINEGIKYIPEDCFKESIGITSVILPSTLISIGKRAFKDNFITSIVIPDSVKYILEDAFAYCGMRNLVLGRTVTYIGIGAFKSNELVRVENNSRKLKYISGLSFLYNKNLFDFDIPDTGAYVYLRGDVFNDESYIKEKFDQARNIIYIRNSGYDIDSKGRNEFYCDELSTDKYTYEKGVLKIHDGVEVLGSFRNLEDCIRVEMPNSVIIILNSAFYGLNKLESVVFSNNLLSVMDQAFFNCNVTKDDIILPNSLCMIDTVAFNNNNGSGKIFIPHTAYAYRSSRAEKEENNFEKYLNTYEPVDSKYLTDIKELLECEITLLDNLNLLPETIIENSKLNKVIDSKQSLLLKKSLIDFITSTEYDETKNIHIVKGLLELKEIDLSDVHELVDHLFEKRQINTIYLLISYGYKYLKTGIISKAITNNMYNMIDVLLLIGSNINEIGVNGMTPLSIACYREDYQLAVHLLDKGASINLVDSHNKKAIDYALENDDKDLVNLLNSAVEKTSTEIDIDEINRILGK